MYYVVPIPALTKMQQLVSLLQRDGGASTAELAATLNWLPHTTRAALTGLRKRGYADLNFSTSVGKKTLERRISAAAKIVCGVDPYELDLNRIFTSARCLNAAVSDTLNNI